MIAHYEEEGLHLKPEERVDLPHILRHSRVSALQPDDEKDKQGTQTNESPVEEAVSRTVAEMHGIEAGLSPMGPILTSEVKVDGSTTKALLDTGSPVNIISLEFFLKAASARRT